jgi:hypothetical protein
MAYAGANLKEISIKHHPVGDRSEYELHKTNVPTTGFGLSH